MIAAFFALGLNTTSGQGLTDHLRGRNPLKEAAETVYMLNMTMPLLAGILSADRLQRDIRFNLYEIQSSTPLKCRTYILAKYLGVLASLLLAALACVLLHGLTAMIATNSSPLFLLAEFPAFAVIVVPAFAMVTAFSLLCTLVLPLRVYQILFTGYWFWGNYLNEGLVPTISGTMLNASGVYAMQGFFNGGIFNPIPGQPYNATQAGLNLVILAALTALALGALHAYLARQTRRA
jgi:ABC-type transport system involved in multi-copper enzyme maturation permease subunit